MKGINGLNQLFCHMTRDETPVLRKNFRAGMLRETPDRHVALRVICLL